MRIFYNLADQTFKSTKSLGIFNVSHGLLKKLATEQTIEKIVVGIPKGIEISDLKSGKVQIQSFRFPSSGRLGRIWWDHVGVYLAAKSSASDWLFLPKGFSSILRWQNPKIACFIHDTIHEHYKKNHPCFFSKSETKYFELCLLSSLQNAAVIFTNSNFSRQQILNFSRKMTKKNPLVVNVGIGFDFPSSIFSSTNKGCTIVFSSNLPHKKTSMAAAFMERWCIENSFDERVDWIGLWPNDLEKPCFPNWKFHGRVSEEGKKVLYKQASRIIYTSEYEGFGMPPVEAVAFGVIPIYSKIPATIEAMGNAGFAFNNDDYASFANAMKLSSRVSCEQLASWRDQLYVAHSWNSVSRSVCLALQDYEQSKVK